MWRGQVCRLLGVVFCAFVPTGVVQAARSVIYVDGAVGEAGDGSSWADAFVHLQDALATAAGTQKPVEIRVAQGTYRPDLGAGVTRGDRDATFQMIDGVTLKGGYAGSVEVDPNVRDLILYETILWGNLNEYPSVHIFPESHVVTCSLTDETAVLDGLTVAMGRDGVVIEGGRPILRDIVFKDNYDGLDINNGSPSLTDCTFIDNEHGIFAWDCNSVLINGTFEGNECGARFVRSHPILKDCTFRRQEDEAVDCTGSLDLLRCSFSDNGHDFYGGTVACHGTLRVFHCTFRSNGRTAVRCGGDTEIADCQFIENSSEFQAGALEVFDYTLKATRCLFVGNSSRLSAGAMTNGTTFAQISHCVFVGNSGAEGLSGAGAIWDSGRTMLVDNCTFAENRGGANVINYRPGPGSIVELSNCIVWNGVDPFTFSEEIPPEVIVNHSNIQGGFEGPGNIDVDPEFVQSGYWADPNDRSIEVGPDDPNAVWVMGDYHLKSQAGHWEPCLQDWVYDDVTSPCLDAGDPNGSLGDELFPNGGYVNLGAYGGTTQASRTYFGSPVCPVHLAGDINGDCVVDQLDMDILLSQWLTDNSESFNIPPAITIVSPQDGAVITSPEPIVLAFDVSDSDGRVLKVNYSLHHEHGNGEFVTSSGISGPRDVWEREHDWVHIKYDGLYTIQAEAVDDNGARTAATEITVTLHP